MDKKTLRKLAKTKRRTLDMKAISSVLAKKITETEVYKNSKNIMLYYPLQDEIDLLALTADKTKTFYLPRIEGENLVCCTYKNGDELCLSCFKTLEPTCDATEKSFIDLAIIPALAVDKNNYRLGYGGGFYDRFLKDFCGKTIVCIPKELLVDTVFPEEFDIPVDYIISQ